ncbi:hypothetical protein HO133_003636 [Letharia lupina]|uniref:Ankyrin repeat protein n=1 Tax=Letharia lupina TaxID=560253 RepID=A0A8H6CAT2_9LECA|nr:uncharacterized protein HO133_003636 [Letharia lupina]KAF6219811.1 hypothetical protein HO133_003636 [Letharia lupina]
MDPVSLSASAAALITIFVQAVKVLKQTIETIRNAKSFLLRLLSQTERIRIFLEQLRALTAQLGPRAGILLNFNDSGPKETINELHAFVQSIAQTPALIRIKVLLNRSAADHLVERLHRHEEEIMQTLLSVAASAAVRTEDEIRRIREDAILHSRITAPFSSEAPVAVDAPDLQADNLRPRVSGMGNSVVGSVDSQKKSSIPSHWEPSMNGFSSLQISDTQTLAEEEYDDTIPQTNDQSHVSRIPKESQDFMQDHDPESAIFEADLFNNDESIEVEQLSKLPVWFGDLSPVGFDRRYLALRDKLSDAAYSGQFETLFQVLADVEHAYAQSWANAPRLSRTPQQASGWIPLHQAVYMGASKDHITRLVRDFGSLRLLRTAWTSSSELPNRNMTALEIAMAIGRWELVDVLNSEILYPISHPILTTLQIHFHNLIRSNLSARPNELAALRLPDLLVLTELELPMMWFPLKSEGPTKSPRMEMRDSGPDIRKERARERVRVRPDILRLTFPDVGPY